MAPVASCAADRAESIDMPEVDAGGSTDMAPVDPWVADLGGSIDIGDADAGGSTDLALVDVGGSTDMLLVEAGGSTDILAWEAADADEGGSMDMEAAGDGEEAGKAGSSIGDALVSMMNPVHGSVNPPLLAQSAHHLQRGVYSTSLFSTSREVGSSETRSSCSSLWALCFTGNIIFSPP